MRRHWSCFSSFVLFFFFLINFIYLFIYLWLSWIFVAVCGLSLVVVSGGYSSLWCMGVSLQWPLLLWSTGSRHAGFSSCGARAQQLWLAGSRAQAQELWCTGLVAPQHAGSSQTRDGTCVPCIGRWILNHGPTREALFCSFLIKGMPWLCLCLERVIWWQGKMDWMEEAGGIQKGVKDSVAVSDIKAWTRMMVARMEEREPRNMWTSAYFHSWCLLPFGHNILKDD